MKTDLIYGVEDRPPFKDALFAALQHLLAIFVAIITPPLIIASALKLDVEKTSFLVSMSLFASGVSTFIQCRRFGPIGAKLLCIQGTSFSFIGPIIATGMVGGLPLIFGSCMAAAPIEMIVSRTFKYLRNIITPLVSGIVVLLIGLSLIKVGIVSCGGGYAAMDNGTFATWKNLSIAALVLLSVLFFNRCGNKYLRMSSIVLGLCLGYGLAFMENLDYKYHAQESNDYVIPDVMIICDRKHLKGGSYTGTPRFIVETLSPATALRDMTVKKEIYQAAGVEEYWIISSKERAVQIYYLEDGKYDLKYSYILQDDPEEEHYNADTVVILKDFPKISMTLAEMFENVE